MKIFHHEMFGKQQNAKEAVDAQVFQRVIESATFSLLVLEQLKLVGRVHPWREDEE